MCAILSSNKMEEQNYRWLKIQLWGTSNRTSRLYAFTLQQVPVQKVYDTIYCCLPMMTVTLYLTNLYYRQTKNFGPLNFTTWKQDTVQTKSSKCKKWQITIKILIIYIPLLEMQLTYALHTAWLNEQDHFVRKLSWRWTCS